MNTNNYILSDSPTKTAKANKFERLEQGKGNPHYLFDFSLLDKTVYITDNKAGKRLISDFINSLVDYVARMTIQSGTKVVITA